MTSRRMNLVLKRFSPARHPAIDAIPQLRSILDEIDSRVRRFVGLSDESNVNYAIFTD